MTLLSPENDQLLIPIDGSYKAFPLVNLLGMSRRMLRSTSNFGHAPLHFITQRGPQQHGSTAVDMRYDVRTIQILLSRTLHDRTDLWEERNELLDLIRPGRSFGAVVRPLVYRKLFPAGKLMQGSDMSVTNGSPTVTANTARFTHYGGLLGGEGITIGGVAYQIDSVLNDFTLVLTANYAAGTNTGVAWSYQRGAAVRDLYCLLERGPTFRQGPGPQSNRNTGYVEALRFVAHDPFWHGLQQNNSWVLPAEFGDLVFDTEGAWLGEVAGDGRWLFAPTAIGETVSVLYYGTFRARPTITISGPATDPSVTNITTGKAIALTSDLLVGESLTIDTQALTITKNDGTNLMPFATGDIATFGLEPAPIAPGRINDVLVAFSGATSDSEAVMSWENLYVGI